MPSNKYALIRYRIIDKCISNKYKPFPTKEDLRRACEDALYGSMNEHISISTIEKDLWVMRYENELNFYAPICYSKLHKGYYYENPDYSITKLPITDEDINALQFAVQTLKQFQGVQIYEQFSTAVEKIADVVDVTKILKEEMKGSSFIQFEKASYFKGSDLLSHLVKAIKDKQVIQIIHKGFDVQHSLSHIVHPYLLKEFRNRWYLIGCHSESKEIRTFGLDRIIQVDILNGIEFQYTTSFHPDIFFQYVFGVSMPYSKPSEVILSFSTGQGNYLKTQPLHHSQEIIKDTKEELRIKIKVVINYELQMQILSYGDTVKVIQPKKLKEDIKAMIMKMADIYH